MRNKKFWLGILVLALMFAMTVIGCPDGSTNDNSNGGGTGGNLDSVLFGTWRYIIPGSGGGWIQYTFNQNGTATVLYS
jgi:hypothetical protein